MKITSDMLGDAIGEILEEYNETIFKATEEGLTKAEKVLIRNLKAASPKNTGTYAKSWKGTGKKYKLKRVVGNTVAVRGKKGKEIALSNVLEYSTKSPHQGKVKQVIQGSIEEMARVMVDEVKKG